MDELITPTLFDLSTIAPAPLPEPKGDPAWDDLPPLKSDSWDDRQFGEPEFIAEPNGQLTLTTTDEDKEPPDPDDYPSREAYDRAWSDWDKNPPALDISPEPLRERHSDFSVDEEAPIAFAKTRRSPSGWIEPQEKTVQGKRGSVTYTYHYYRYELWSGDRLRKTPGIRIDPPKIEFVTQLIRQKLSVEEILELKEDWAK